ncbi:MAG: polysaccharide pyruvyl transferase family protein [Clostridia bacterium]|nr:polysaccharide pyruvyl transferase family protein [Clostridia bacterium]
MDSKKKIGIVTFHSAQNYGANLQADALQKYINDNIGESEIIDFNPFKKPKHSLVRKAYQIFKRITDTKYRQNYRRKKAFISFQKKHYTLSDKQFYTNDICEDYLLKYKTIISGSDQILNTELTNGCSFYYLPFSGSYKKISFSSSYGKETLSKLDIEFVKKYLSHFDYLSFREESGVVNTKNLLPSKEILLSCDPVFLLSAEHWLKLSHESNLKIKDKNYILLYAMEKSEHIERCVNFIKSKEKLPVYAIFGDDTIVIDGVDRVINIAGPVDFLKLINDATFFITNSFHGSAFSFVFGKNAYICSHSTKNTRIETLLKIAKCNDKIYSNTSQFPTLINGKEGYKNICNSIVAKSKEYLNHSLR